MGEFKKNRHLTDVEHNSTQTVALAHHDEVNAVLKLRRFPDMKDGLLTKAPAP